jgi:hypothetical protein
VGCLLVPCLLRDESSEFEYFQVTSRVDICCPRLL